MSKKETLEALKYCCACTNWIPGTLGLTGKCTVIGTGSTHGTSSCSSFSLIKDWDKPILSPEIKND